MRCFPPFPASEGEERFFPAFIVDRSPFLDSSCPEPLLPGFRVWRAASAVFRNCWTRVFQSRVSKARRMCCTKAWLLPRGNVCGKSVPKRFMTGTAAVRRSIGRKPPRNSLLSDCWCMFWTTSFRPHISAIACTEAVFPCPVSPTRSTGSRFPTQTPSCSTRRRACFVSVYRELRCIRSAACRSRGTTARPTVRESVPSWSRGRYTELRYSTRFGAKSQTSPRASDSTSRSGLRGADELLLLLLPDFTPVSAAAALDDPWVKAVAPRAEREARKQSTAERKMYSTWLEPEFRHPKNQSPKIEREKSSIPCTSAATRE